MLNKKNDTNTIIKSLYILTLIVVLVVAAVTIWFRNANRVRVSDNNVNYLEEAVRQKVELIEAELDMRLTTIKNYSYIYESAENKEMILTSLLYSWEYSGLFDYVQFIDTEGNAYTSEGRILDRSNEEYFVLGMKGNSGYIKSSFPGLKNSYICFYTPVVNENGSTEGVMVAFMGKEKINAILETFFFGSRANVMLMQGDGEVISYSTDIEVDASLDDMYDIVFSIGNLTPEVVAELHDKLSKGEGVTVEYVGSAKTLSHARIEPISHNGWFIVESFPSIMENQMVQKANSTADDLIVMLAFILMAYLIFIYIEYREYKKKNDALEKEKIISRTDPMTGLGNRTAYEEDMLAASMGELDLDGVLISLDLNELKAINDNFGHAKGDDIIRVAASIIKEVLGKYGNIYRIGGDEFTACLKMPKSKVESAINEINEKLANYTDDDGISISISTGYVCISDNPGTGIYELAKLADIQMYRCKSRYYASEGHDRRKYKQQKN